MSESRSRLSLIFKPTPDEQRLPFMLRARFAMMGVNELKPLTAQTQPELSAMLDAVSQKAGIQTPIAYIWDSKHPIANAVAVPTNPPIVALSKTITELLTPEELAAVTAHELGHVKNMNHSTLSYWGASLVGLAVGETLGRPMQRRVQTEIRKGNANPLLKPADFLLTLGRFIAPVAAGAVASRKEERSADSIGAATMGDAVPLISALEKLTQHNSETSRGPVGKLIDVVTKPITVLTRSHPTFEQRRKALGVSKEAIAEYRDSHGDSMHVHKPGDAENHMSADAGNPAGPGFAEAEAPERTSKWQARMQARETSAAQQFER